MIGKFRSSFFGKCMSILMLYVFLIDLIIPLNVAYGLTGGPAQPEFNAFTPIGTSDMVDLSSGDFTYNIPLMDVGGFPINLAYSSGVNMDQEASWVGLGWDLSIGQINRQMRGIPDDFQGDQMTYENDMKDNFTVGTSFNVEPNLAGVPAFSNLFDLSIGLSAQYNSYTGMSLSPSAGISYDIANMGSVGLNVQSDENGLTVSPNLSLHTKMQNSKLRDSNLGASFGVSFNSRQGLSNFNMSASRSSVFKLSKKRQYASKSKASGSLGSSISFVDNSYTPTVQDGVNTGSFTFNAAGGFEFFIVEGQGQIGAFGSNQFIPNSKKSVVRSAYGYDNTHMANEASVKDFNREKDGAFSVNSTNLPLTNYTYDIYSIQGQGVSGTFRPYRSQVGYVSDNTTSTAGGGGSAGVEFGGGQAFHMGVDVDVNWSNNVSGNWDAASGNNAIQHFDPSTTNTNQLYEEVYYKQVGDLAVDTESDMYGTHSTKLGEYSPIRLKLGGSKFQRTLEPEYQIKHESSPSAFYGSPITGEYKRNERLVRNQNILKVRNDEITNDDGTLLGFVSNPYAKPHHTAGFIVTRNDGARYVYGEALYNIKKEEVTFAVEGRSTDCSKGIVKYIPGDNSINNQLGDEYYNKITTGAYAHTFLLTTLLSSDYSDVDGVAGPSVNDYGSYTTFSYRTPLNQKYYWRIPFVQNTANYNEGLKTDPTDDKGSYVYGHKEVKYIQKIETKTHVAIFHISQRKDGFGVQSNAENGSSPYNATNSVMYKLDKIELYSAGEFTNDGTDSYGNIISNATPIKTVYFEYDYELCQGVHNNADLTLDQNELANQRGKLTLKRVYFTYRNSNMGQYSDYEFTYGYNPTYNMKGYDIWGNYKENSASSGCDPLNPITAPENMYVDQYDPSTTNENMSAWSITKIELPSGGEINVEYEADDYQYVQDKKAMQMLNVVGSGPDVNPSAQGYFDPGNQMSNSNSLLYKSGNSNNQTAKYLYVELPETGTISTNEFRSRYLKGIKDNYDDLIQFRFLMNMNKKGGKNSSWTDGYFDYVTGYFKLDYDGSKVFNYGGKTYGSVKMQLVNLEGGVAGGLDVNPIAKAGWFFGRKYLPRYIYGLPDQNQNASESEIVNAILQTTDNLMEVFAGPNGVLKSKKIARRFIPGKSWIRLMNPDGKKLGGGCRVKQITMSDDWADMTADEYGGNPNQEREQFYGQVYNYTLDDGTSSGVAAYEPVGCKENPWVQPVFVNEQRLLAPDEENYIEKPFGESFFPGATVTYGKVTVKNLQRYDGVSVPNKQVKKHATGKVVTEFYTSKDYPTITDQTELQVHEDKSNPLAGLLNLNVLKHITLTQGYLVHVNDMNGKMKSERVYAEDQSEYISGVDYVYDGFSATSNPNNPFTLVVNNGGKINNDVLTLSPDGKIEQNTLGVEYDVINDFREKRSTTDVISVNGNVATFFVGFIPGIIPVPLPDYAHHEDKLNMVTTTKVINTFGVQREVIAHDAGASVYTRNLLWDSKTGEVLLTETVNEYGDKYYSLNFPAHWYYDGMGLASENSGATILFDIGGSDYVPVGTSQNAQDLFENGDEVILYSGTQKLYGWVKDVSSSGFSLMNAAGNDINISTPYGLLPGMVAKIVRSGKRNVQSTSMASVVMMKNPLDLVYGNQLPPNWLSTNTWNSNKVVNAGAVEFDDNWALQCECGTDNTTAADLNAYRFNMKGVWRAVKSHLYLTGRHQNTGDPDPRNDGFYNDFSPFYYIDANGNWHINNNNWTYTSLVTMFSPHGFELENKDALNRYSAAQYGYNYSFPLAVGANTKYSQMGYDGFEDYSFDGCSENEHFGFRDVIVPLSDITGNESHTGKYSLKITANGSFTKVYHVDCIITP
jgi:hypothetical protein